jgi:DNA polymerase I-like protein with 3'-5' exonuclease and polymerase domains
VYIEYSKAHKLTSTFGLNYFKFVNKITGRIHTTYKQIMNTGRMSCGENNKKTGEEFPNLQQVPSDHVHRECFVSENGNSLIAADYKGQEDIIFANKCLDKNLLEFYDKKLGDGHSYVAKLCFPELKEVPLEDIKSKHKDLRQLAKAANFAIKFGGVGQTISNNLALSKEEGERIYNNYMKAFPGIASYFKKMADEALKNGYIEINNVTNRKSFVDFYPEYIRLKEIIEEPGFWDLYRSEKLKNSDKFINELKSIVRDYFKYQGMIQRRSFNFPVQGSGADVTKLAACYMFDFILENNLFNKVKIVNLVHDEILIECPTSIEDKISKKLEECMIKSGKVFFTRIPLEAESSIGNYWIH